MLVKGLQWWVMGLNPHNCTRSTGATTIPLLQNIYPNHGIISSDSFHLKVYNFEKKMCSPWFTPMTIRLRPRLPEDLKSWIAEASSDSSCFNCTWQGNRHIGLSVDTPVTWQNFGLRELQNYPWWCVSIDVYWCVTNMDIWSGCWKPASNLRCVGKGLG